MKKMCNTVRNQVLIIALTTIVCATSSANEMDIQSETYSPGSTNSSIFSKNQKFDNEGVELYSTNLELKSYKKIGATVSMGGMSGALGLSLEVNLQPIDALFLGLGTGKGYNSFNFGWKRNFTAEYLSPYTKVGFSKWFNDNSGPGTAQDSDVLKTVLSESEINQNKFGANFLAGGMGLEYNQLEGDLAGVNFFGELILMNEISKSTIVPTGAIGATYFY